MGSKGNKNEILSNHNIRFYALNTFPLGGLMAQMVRIKLTQYRIPVQRQEVNERFIPIKFGNIPFSQF